MKSFKYFYIDLNESLNTPHQYFLTDDTDAKDTYARFQIDGQEYMASLVESKVPGVFEITMGRVKKNKPRYWAFHSPNHILPAFSTLLHFLESTIAFRGALIQGAYLRVRGKRDVAKRMERFTKRILDRTFVKTFQYVDVEQPPEDKITEYSFWFSVMIIKKGLSPASVFNKAHFKKYNFEYAGKQDKIPAEAIETLQTKKVSKKKLTDEPSKKYSFKGLDLDLTIDTETFENVIQSVKPADKDEAKSGIDYSNMKEHEKAAIFAYLMPSLSGSLLKHGYDESKLNWKDMEYVLKNKDSETKKVLEKIGISAPSNWSELNDETKNLIKSYSKTISDYSKGKLETKKSDEYANAKYGHVDTWKTNAESKTVLKSNIDPKSLKVDIPGYGEPVTNGYNWGEIGENLNKKQTYIADTLGYHDKVKNVKNFKIVQAYTGSKYEDYNYAIRGLASKFFKGENLTKYDIQTVIKSTGSISKMTNAFEYIDPLPEPMWVYRGGFVQEDDEIFPGSDYVEPAFMSASIMAGINFGNSLRLRIYLPKGSKVIPVLRNSNHPSEKEVILPPMSVIKIIEVDKQDFRYFATGIFVGSAFKDFKAKLKDLPLNEGYDINLARHNVTKRLLEMKKDKNEKDEYDPEEKFSSVYDPKLSKAIADMLRKKKSEK